MNNKNIQSASARSRKNRSTGFTLVELMVAMAIFMVVGGAAVGLLRTHAPLYATQQGQVGLNVNMRNAVAQMQMDVVNAGSGFYPGANMPFFPVGITISNNTAGNFDKLNVITSDPAMPPTHPSGNSAGTVHAKTDSPDLWLYFPAPTGTQLTDGLNTLTTLVAAGKFPVFVLVQGGSDFTSAVGPKMTTVTVTKVVAIEGNSIHVQHAAVTDAAGVPATVPDSFGIITTGDEAKCTNDFDPNQDYVIKIIGVTYQVDTSDATNPKLVRIPLGSNAAGSPNIVADQIVGFKVGAWSSKYSQAKAAAAGATANDPTASNYYSFDSAADYVNDWTSIRAVRINLVGRTPPSSDPNHPFKNSYDNGTYQTQAISVVINPRNLSM